MYTVSITQNTWIEARMWLEQNYLCLNRDYNYKYTNNTVEVTMYSSDNYEWFCQRWSVKQP